jgi:hypothetical protein
MNSPRRPMTAANGYSLFELADCARATQRRIIAISNASESCLIMALTFAARRTVKMISDCPRTNNDDCSRHQLHRESSADRSTARETERHYSSLPDRCPARSNVQDGSIASFWSLADYFRSLHGNGHYQGRSPCRKKCQEATLERHPDGAFHCGAHAKTLASLGRQLPIAVQDWR